MTSLNVSLGTIFMASSLALVRSVSWIEVIFSVSLILLASLYGCLWYIALRYGTRY